MADEEILVLDTDNMMRLWLYDKLAANELTEIQADQIWREHRSKAEFGAGYGAYATDGALLLKLARDMRTPMGRVVYKSYGGKPHVILKGNPRLRTILTGTRYGVNNAKIVSMGIGKHGALNSVKSGTIVSIIIVSVFRITDYVLRDEATLTQLVGALGVDIVKIAIASAAGAMAAKIAAGTLIVASVAAGPLIAAVAVGIVVTVALNALDERYHLTARVQKALDEAMAKAQRMAEQTKQSIFERGRNMLLAAGSAVIDLAVDFAADRARRLIDDVISWRPLPRL